MYQSSSVVSSPIWTCLISLFLVVWSHCFHFPFDDHLTFFLLDFSYPFQCLFHLNVRMAEERLFLASPLTSFGPVLSNDLNTSEIRAFFSQSGKIEALGPFSLPRGATFWTEQSKILIGLLRTYLVVYHHRRSDLYLLKTYQFYIGLNHLHFLLIFLCSVSYVAPKWEFWNILLL